MQQVCSELGVSERRACQVLAQARSTHRYRPKPSDERIHLEARTLELALSFGRYGYRRVTGLLRAAGSRHPIVAGDVMELAPGEGPVASAFTAAKLVYKLAGYALFGGSSGL